MHINTINKKKGNILNITEIKVKTNSKEIVKLKSMKEKAEMFNFSPSEFAFGFEGCKRCYYDKKVNGIELKVPFPGIFSKFDSLQKNFYHGKSSKTLTDNLEEGEIVGDFNKMLRSEVLYDLKDRPFTMSGKIDAYIKHKDSFTIVDFKTTKISENKIDAYATQLQSYALMMEKPKEGSLKLTPIKRLGIFCFEPSNISKADGYNCNIHMDTQWYDIPRDDKDLVGYITKIQDVLYSNETPESGSSCGICNFRKVMK
jgi:hypothetical protein